MAGLTVTTRNTMLSSIFTATLATGKANYGSLHTADPGTTGASEATGGSPAYARKVITWAAPSGGSASGGTITFDVPAGTYTHIGYWDIASGGTSTNFVGGYPLQASMTYGAQGTLPVTLTETLT
jgi:hypothetical protein